MTEPKTAEVKVVPVEPTEDAPRTHVPALERFAVNPMPKSNDWCDLRLFRYDGTDLYQWFGKRSGSVFEDAGCEPFLMRPAPSHIGEAAGMVAPAQSGWGGTESAPRDGTAIIAVFSHLDRPVVAWVTNAGPKAGSWTASHSLTYRATMAPGSEPTHWMPLPAAPGEAPASPPAEKGEGELDADDLVSRLRGEPGDCAFCGRDPYHYVDNGVGMERVAVTCCDEGIALYQHGDEVLSRQVQLRYEAADEIERLSSLYTHPASDQSDTERMRALVREYRPSMDKDVLHAWAADVVAALAEKEAGQ